MQFRRGQPPPARVPNRDRAPFLISVRYEPYGFPDEGRVARHHELRQVVGPAGAFDQAQRLAHAPPFRFGSQRLLVLLQVVLAGPALQPCHVAVGYLRNPDPLPVLDYHAYGLQRADPAPYLFHNLPVQRADRALPLPYPSARELVIALLRHVQQCHLLPCVEDHRPGRAPVIAPYVLVRSRVRPPGRCVLRLRVFLDTDVLLSDFSQELHGTAYYW